MILKELIDYAYFFNDSFLHYLAIILFIIIFLAKYLLFYWTYQLKIIYLKLLNT